MAERAKTEKKMKNWWEGTRERDQKDVEVREAGEGRGGEGEVEV